MKETAQEYAEKAMFGKGTRLDRGYRYKISDTPGTDGRIC